MTGVRSPWVTAACRSDAGRVRSNNEDLPVCDPDAGILGVIDGVGGQTAGEVAAGIAQRVIRERLSRPLGAPADRVREAIALANNEIWKLSEEHPEYDGMTCVLTLAVVNDGRITIGHVGDSRCYKVTASGLRKLTHDHSPVGEREDAGELTEQQAMRHPRRNEVFRDVGSGYRDKDDRDFIDIVEDTLEPDAAILLCTDGLTDMIDTTAIERVIRSHAGDPQAVADGLVATANDAGGKDNITVVYGEGPGFPAAMRGAAPAIPATGGQKSAGPVVRGARWIGVQHATWLAVGVLIGVSAALALSARLGGNPSAAAGQTLVVGANAPFIRIADALNAARPGDAVQVDSGTYAERVSVPDGVDLVARVAGSVTLRRAVAADGDWVAVTASGPGKISGIRFESTATAPIAVGIRISGADRHVMSCDVDGPMRAGIELTDARSATIESTAVHISGGAALAIVGGSDIRIAHSTFVRGGGVTAPALSLKDTVRLTLWRNVFGGYGNELLRGLTAAERDELLADAHNFVF
ncbi:MAG TPA: protein phosphatase 2C domain-containing protein [Vicinamibacterales bacterium]|nr:protein phosphatase 2C domain-containing protein [Vicinamibacterales bacterium]